MDPDRAAALATTLGVVLDSDVLPPFFHQAYFWDAQPAGMLGPDGHPAVGSFIPDLGLPRRMWAGGRLRFVEPLRAGICAARQTTICSVDRKTGRTGALGFVTLRHVIRQAGTDRVIEEQDLVYREPARSDAPPQASTPAPDDRAATALHFDSTLLFRYSALTFNGHRIHYDADYARSVEGYRGVVVHGPLLAQRMMLAAAEERPLDGFTFRGYRALTLGESAVMCRQGRSFWVRNGSGDLVMEAEATWQ